MQGIGGAGTYSLVFVIFFEMVPPQKFARYQLALDLPHQVCCFRFSESVASLRTE